MTASLVPRKARMQSPGDLAPASSSQTADARGRSPPATRAQSRRRSGRRLAAGRLAGKVRFAASSSGTSRTQTPEACSRRRSIASRSRGLVVLVHLPLQDAYTAAGPHRNPTDEMNRPKQSRYRLDFCPAYG